MNRSAFCAVLFIVLIAACKSKEKTTDNDTGFFPAVPYLQSQARHIDSSLYSIVKISKAHGVVDTTYLQREAFKGVAQDFLSLPDIASAKLKKKYEETKLYDGDLKKVVITYQPKDKSDFELIMREDVLIEPGAGAADQVQTIYIETLLNSGDSTVQKKLTWNMNQNFQIIKLVNKTGQPEEVQTTDVRWSGGQ